MTWNSMSHVGLEADYATPDQLTQMSTSWHYGWRWKGPEGDDIDICHCDYAPCGLIKRIDEDCPNHEATAIGRAKQLHKGSDCPATTT